ncbi:MAG: lipoyl(octanoyl) transferase LipB [candidate division WOR-3 bacterium]|nr:lipoyl(octanoyl) transferase LipB [candidate division WOR-3 bacterium]MDW8150178.1 lipoyl(octanoyl) transferase LipB [candidate division WOR-3 bacterium]
MDAIVIRSNLIEYKKALEIQKIIHNLRKSDVLPDTLWLLEHEPVITLGRSGKIENLLVPEDYLKKIGINIYYVERGGDITYHGPGQIIGYVFFKIDGLDKVRDFVGKIETAIITALKKININAKTIEKHRGVWVNQNKICAIGVAIKDWVSFHGFALYLNPIMEHFNLIVPCGIMDKGITSVYKETSIDNRKLLEELLILGFQEVFNISFREEKLEEILKMEVKV